MATSTGAQALNQQDASAVDCMLRFLWDVPDRGTGWSILSLPDPLRNERLLIVCASEGLIEFGDLKFNGNTGEQYWESQDFSGNRPYSPYVQAVLARRAPVNDSSTDPGFVRLTGQGELTYCRSLSKPDPAPAPGVAPREWLGKALLCVRDHPDWSNAQIARAVGVHPSQLTRKRCPEFHNAVTLARGTKDQLRKGYIQSDSDSNTLAIEAPTYDIAELDDKADRGQPIPGSKYVREYCADCGEPMKVKPEQVGKNPLCVACKP
jgi:hypothetical protein